MIREDEVFKIGKFTKPHGVKGEIAFAFENDVFDRVECSYLICKVDGIFVPFFMEEYRFKGKETALITLEDMDSEDKVQPLTGLDVYFPRSYFEEEENDVEYSWNFFIGFTVIDELKGQLGTITNIDTATINTLFVLEGEEEEYLIPAVEEFILNIDAASKILQVSLPEGLIE